MELDQIRLVLVLAEQLHFGRTGQRLHISQARVSKQLAALERELGGVLFDRSSRHVRLTPLGQQFVSQVGPAYQNLLDRVAHLHDAGQPRIRIGFLPTTGGAALGRVVRAFEHRHREITVQLKEIPFDDPYAALRDADIDVLASWRTPPEPGITVGPTIDRPERVAMLSTKHPLANRTSASVLEVDDWAQAANVRPQAIREAFLPPTASDGTPIPRSPLEYTNLQELLSLVSRNLIAHATVTSAAEFAHRDDIVLIPIHDLPPIDLALLWWTAHETETIRTFAQVARGVFRVRRPELASSKDLAEVE
ncbi:LysR family transcriptional regulator [Flindersiella endophytica]